MVDFGFVNGRDGIQNERRSKGEKCKANHCR